jgi:hypothetical protein
VRKAGWPMALVMDSDGRVHFLHALHEEEAPLDCAGATRLSPGQWRHVVVTVDRQAGRTRLYMDGSLETAADFPAGAATSTDEDVTRPFRALGLEPGETTGCRFRGDAEDIRMYDRVLPDDEITDLVRLGALWK